MIKKAYRRCTLYIIRDWMIKGDHDRNLWFLYSHGCFYIGVIDPVAVSIVNWWTVAGYYDKFKYITLWPMSVETHNIPLSRRENRADLG